MEQGEISGNLVSQIAYDTQGTKRVVCRRSPGGRTAPETFTIRDLEGAPVFTGPLKPWGQCWGSDWWTGDFSAFDTEGSFYAAIEHGAHATRTDAFNIKTDGLFELTWKPVSIDQAERRQWMVESRIGWYDAGTLWQECNSHSMYILGLCDLLQLRSDSFSVSDRNRIEQQIINGLRYLNLLQDRAQAQGLGNGAVVHQAFKFDSEVVLADVAKASAAWARASEVLGPPHTAERQDYRVRARRALDWLEDPQPPPSLPFNSRAYGVAADTTCPSEIHDPLTQDLLMMLEAELALAADTIPLQAVKIVRRLAQRQIGPEDDFDTQRGLFRRQDGSDLTTKAWSHGFSEAAPLFPSDAHTEGDGGKLFPSDVGNVAGFYLLPICRMLDRFPNHPEAKQWYDLLATFAYDFWLPACRKNPFGISPYGHFPGEGPLYFSGLWHGCNTVYGLAAALAFDLARILADPAFREIGEANLQWIAGLNAGLTQEAADSCILVSHDVAATEALPVSMIHGIGNRFAGSWLNIRGSICNGFSTGESFKWDVPPRADLDRPQTFSDEDWITHAGAWLMGVSRSKPRQER